MTSAAIAHHRESDGATQSVEEHLLGVAARARGLAQKIGLAEQGELIGIVHDLGKYSDEFQSYSRSAVDLLDQDDEEVIDAKSLKGKVDHSEAAQFIWTALAEDGQLGHRNLDQDRIRRHGHSLRRRQNGVQARNFRYCTLENAKTKCFLRLELLTGCCSFPVL